MPDAEPLIPPSSSEIAGNIREFVLQRFPLARQGTLDDRSPLLDSGIVDSLGILELVQFLVDRYGIEVTDEDLMPDNFQSIESLARFVEAKNGRAT